MALAGAGKRLLMGTCVPCMRHNASKIKIKRLELDENLLAVRHSISQLFSCMQVKVGRYINDHCHKNVVFIFSISRKKNLYLPTIQKNYVKLGI